MKNRIIKAAEKALAESREDDDCIDRTEIETVVLAGLLKLVKEQEAVKPVKKDMVGITARYEYDCQCGAPLLIGQPYCAYCGRPVKWDAN